MRLTGFSIIIFLFGLSVTVGAQSVQQVYQSANALYKGGKFDSAVAAYENIIRQGYKSPEVYYNLGNSYYKTDNVSKTILAYERALKLAPQDEDVIHNLKLANAKVVDKIIPVPQMGLVTGWDNLLSSRSSKGWAVWSLGVVWLALLAFVIYLFTSMRRPVIFLGGLMLLLSFVFMSFAYKQNNKERGTDSAILTVSNTFVKSAPDTNGNDLFMLHEGVKFQILGRVGEWTKIRLADGKIGWVEHSTFEKI
jgi:tetratricopeptide (TPR) repeat protein